ncbi:MAG: type II toxin-antitoxin system HicB family antitoxin [Tepidisphaeraceae bacterium]
MRYAIVIEKAEKNYSAYLPDVPGCVATGATVDEVKRNLAEALELHFDGTQSDGDAIPAPTAAVDYIDVPIPARRAAG